MTRGNRSIASKTAVNAAGPIHPSRGSVEPKKFMPKKPVKNERGINSVVMTVNVFITSFIRLFTTDKYKSMLPSTKSRTLSLQS